MSSVKNKSQLPLERLLEAADRLFYEQGFGATGINQLIAEANIAKATFYQHFPGKTDLVVAYLESRAEKFNAALEEAIGQLRSPKRRLVGMFEFVAEWLVETDYRGCAFQNAVAEFPDAESPPRRMVREIKDAQRNYIGELCREVGRAELGDEIFLSLEGATIQSSITRATWPIKVAKKSASLRLRD